MEDFGLRLVVWVPVLGGVETVESRILVLAARPYRENSLLLDVLCEREGRLSLVGRPGKGKSRDGRRAAALSALALSEVRFRIRPGTDMGTITDATLLESWEGLRANLEGYGWACLGAEAAARGTASRQGDGEVFQQLLSLLENLNRCGREVRPGIVVSGMEGLASAMGLSLDLGRCRECGSVHSLSFGIQDGSRPGVLCAQCGLASGHYVPLDGLGRDWIGMGSLGRRRTLSALALWMPGAWGRLLGQGLKSGLLLARIYGLGDVAG
jgi:DNA repair protein RecO